MTNDQLSIIIKQAADLDQCANAAIKALKKAVAASLQLEKSVNQLDDEELQKKLSSALYTDAIIDCMNIALGLRVDLSIEERLQEKFLKD